VSPRVFIDGESGTVGLEIRERLAARKDLTLLSLESDRRRDVEARRRMLNESDAAILCLPDGAAGEAVALVESNSVAVIDASTAHRTAPGWTYGFPEMAAGQRGSIAAARRIANPGCWATAFIALVRPLVAAGLVPADWPVSAHGVSGYSGGSKAMIAEFEDASSPDYTEVPFRLYALGLAHKHLPEMQAYAGLARRPLFSPAVGRYRQGMLVETPLQLEALPGSPTPADVRDCLAEAYEGERFVEVASEAQAAKIRTLDPESLNGGNRLRLHVFASERGDQARLVALLDNLGKGAAGAAVQNLNIVLGLPETSGL